MPEVQEVFRMATQKVRPEPGGLERQFQGQRRRSARRKAAAVGLVAALVIVAGVVAIQVLRDLGQEGGGTVPADTGPAPSTIELNGFGEGFSEDGTRLLVTSEDNSREYLYDSATGELLQTVDLQYEHGDGLIAFSSDRRLFATAVGDPACCDTYVYGTATGRELAHVGKACCYAVFSPDGTQIAVPYFLGDEHASRVVDAETGATVNEFDFIGNFAFSPDGRQIAVTSDEEGIIARVFDLGGPIKSDPVLTLPGENSGEALDTQVAWSADGSTIATSNTGRDAVVWDATTGEMRFEISSPSGRITWVDYGSDPTRVATGSSDGTAIVWDISGGEAQPLITHHFDVGKFDFLAVDLSPDGSRLMATNARYETTVWGIP
jgi:WD40 repeat protein